MTDLSRYRFDPESFLLIACTRHIVTVRGGSDGTRWCALVARDSQVFQHMAEFYNYLGQLIVTAAVYRGLALLLCHRSG